MEEKKCTNFETCRLVSAGDFEIKSESRTTYIEQYCLAGKSKWIGCKRFITKSALNFCPDFVLPDTTLSPDEIIDKFDEKELS